MSFEHTGVRKTLFLNARFCWDSRDFLYDLDQKFNFVGTNGYGDLYFEFLFRQFQLFRLHAMLHDAAGPVRANSGTGLVYCYMIARGPKSCLLGQVIGLIFCFYVKLFLPSISNSVDILSSMSCIVLDVEHADLQT